jgi:acyl-coenzyme A synthetase/AMP-(fatty) acid ligase
VVLHPGKEISAGELRQAVNDRLGKVQRISTIVFLDALPRSHIGKVLKRELRDSYQRKLAVTESGGA